MIAYSGKVLNVYNFNTESNNRSVDSDGITHHTHTIIIIVPLLSRAGTPVIVLLSVWLSIPLRTVLLLALTLGRLCSGKLLHITNILF